ncbi:hypothetical protein ACJZ2D_003735 [Fusarium nematophilum]
MNSTTAQDSAQSASGAASASASTSKGYDEERQQWESTPRRSTCLRLPRLRKATIYLLLMDILIVALVVRAFEPLITLLRRNEEMFGARLTLPVNETVAAEPDESSDRQTIPRIFHQTSATEEVREDWVLAHQSCQDAYSDFEYKLWTDDLARDFISSEYPWFLETWDNYPFPIQRADAIRYFVLYHYGGIYLDMDTICNETIPFHQIEADGAEHHAVFKSTTPTGVSNDLMISSARHPLFTATISNLLFFNGITRFWSALLPHAAIMVSAGPFFLTMSIKHYLLELPSLPTPAVQVINATELAPYITDLEGCSWHHGDTRTLMWVGDRPWVWFALGAIGLAAGLHVINHGLMLVWKGFDKLPAVNDDEKVAKLM